MKKALDLRDLMQRLQAAHKEFQREWKEYKTRGYATIEPKTVVSRRKKFLTAGRQLFDYLEPLDHRFREGDEQALDEVIDFLSIDVPAFRCGYLKEKWLRRLKSAPLTTAQKQRLIQAAISLCANPHYRREMTEWNRLMIKLADEALIRSLIHLAEDPNEFVKTKAGRMLYVILNSRRNVVSPYWVQSALLNCFSRRNN